MANTTDGVIGVDLTKVTAGTTTDGVDRQFKLGTIHFGTDSQEYVYLQAGAAISTLTTEPFALGIDENYQAVKLTKALADAGHAIGFAPQQVIADNAFFWGIRLGSNFNIRVAANCAADAALFTTSTAGVLDDASSSQTRVGNVVIVASASVTATTLLQEAIVSGRPSAIAG